MDTLLEIENNPKIQLYSQGEKIRHVIEIVNDRIQLSRYDLNDSILFRYTFNKNKLMHYGFEMIKVKKRKRYILFMDLATNVSLTINNLVYDDVTSAYDFLSENI